MAEPSSFSKFVPGFDFLQGLVKNAGAAIPGLGQWVAPTLNPQELEKRIEELRTVQFWLEQNARMLGATIQALEVQRMTLSTLQAMNVPMADLKSALKAAPNPFAAPAAGDAGNAGDDATADAPAASRAEPKAAGKSAAKPAEAATPAVDPMQWWSALTQQFTQLATSAMKDTATDAAKNLAGAMMKQSIEAASDTLRKAAAVPGAMVSGVAQAATAQRAKASRAKAPAAAAPAPAKASRAAPRTATRSTTGATTGAKRKT